MVVELNRNFVSISNIAAYDNRTTMRYYMLSEFGYYCLIKSVKFDKRDGYTVVTVDGTFYDVDGNTLTYIKGDK